MFYSKMAIQNLTADGTNNTIDTFFEMTGADFKVFSIALINFIQVQIQGLSADEVFVEINGNSTNMNWIQLFDNDGINPFDGGDGSFPIENLDGVDEFRLRRVGTDDGTIKINVTEKTIKHN